MRLESLQNPRLKALRSLHARKGRMAAGSFLLETTRLVLEAMACGWELSEIFATSEWLAQHGPLPGHEVTEVASGIFGPLVTTESPEGIVAVARLPVERPIPFAPRSWYVLVEALQDPGNLGTIIRTADAVGLDAVLTGPGTVDPFSPKVVRGSMGAIFHLPVLVRRDLGEDLELLKQQGVRVLAAAHGGRSLYDLELTGSLAWVIGNEGTGLSPEMKAAADEVVSIPMPGRAESLNAAMAAAVCLYETLRQRLR